MDELKLTQEELNDLAELLHNDDSSLARKLRAAAFPERIINLTAHEINVFDENNRKIFTLPADASTTLRAETERRIIGKVKGIPIYDFTVGEIDDLPPEVPGTYYVVSRIAARAAQRDDFLVTDLPVRDAYGTIIGVRGFAKS